LVAATATSLPQLIYTPHSTFYDRKLATLLIHPIVNTDLYLASIYALLISAVSPD